MKIKKDLRVVRTNRLIINSFLQLLREKSFDKITISEISNHAMINRATFYAHFKNKDDLYESLIDYFFEDISDIINREDLTDERTVNVKNIEGALEEIYHFIKKNPEFGLILLDSGNERLIRRKLLDFLDDKYLELLAQLDIREDGLQVPTDFVVSYIIGIFTSSLKWWMDNLDKITPQELSHLVIKLISNGHLTVLGVNINRR
ncbi:TetR/AcrR family transcriptional regulator [Streptococcaceae bacterium ESL0687]|nr:TetR/AcrR family transcriptional regulator [Streptococcaceae bacterium ESL0687]